MKEDKPIPASNSITFNYPNPVEKYRCTRGHTWESNSFDSINLTWPLMGIDEQHCVLCIREWTREYIGKVKKV